MHFHHPPAQHVHNQLTGNGMVAVAGVAAARIVEIGLGPGVKQVVNGVVYAAEAGAVAVLPTLGGMVEDHVQIDFNASPVEGLDHVPEFMQDCGRIAAV